MAAFGAGARGHISTAAGDANQPIGISIINAALIEMRIGDFCFLAERQSARVSRPAIEGVHPACLQGAGLCTRRCRPGDRAGRSGFFGIRAVSASMAHPTAVRAGR